MFTIGTDSEHGLYLNGALVSAIDRIPGEKKAPVPLANGGGLQVDGVLLEWNSPISHTIEEFNNNIEGTLKEIDIFTGHKYTLGYESSYIYPMEELSSELAWIIGCEPDYSAYKYFKMGSIQKAKNNKPQFMDMKNPALRTAAAHIHVSPFTNKNKAIKMVRVMDIMLGLPSLFIDKDTMRRALYGQAGSFRLKTYPNRTNGVEYRVLGSFWVKEKVYRDWVFSTTKEIYENLEEYINRFSEETYTEVSSAIDNYNYTVANRLISKLGIKMP